MTSSAHIATRSIPTVSHRWSAAAIAVFVPTPSVEETMSGLRYRSGTAMAPANPPMEPPTSGRCVDSTAERMSSTARSPAVTSTPARTYASRGAEPFEAASAMRREWLFEHELPARGVVRHGLGVAPIEAGEAEPLIRQLERAQDALDREIAERIGADELADLLDRARRRDQLG